MTASSLALFLSLATAGVGEGAARVESLGGVVIGPEGRPVGGAEVIAASGSGDGGSSVILGRTRSDAEGRFVVRLAEELSGCDRPMLWAVAPGLVAGSCLIDRRALDGGPFRIGLSSRAAAGFAVSGPDGHPVVGARITPLTVAREGSFVPSVVGELTAAMTDVEGRVELDSFRPEELLSVSIEATGFGIQVRKFRGSDGLASNGTKAITLTAIGRVIGRVTASDPQSISGLVVRVDSTGTRGGASAGYAEVATDLSGHFDVPAIASGAVTIRVRPRQGSPDLPARVIQRHLEAGRTLETEIPLRRGVRVTGVALSGLGRHPVAGVIVAVVPSGHAEPTRVRTDDQGRYEAYVPAGLVSHRVLEVPSPYLCPPSFVGSRPVEVPPAIARFELPPIQLQKGGELRGQVTDSKNQPVSSARIEASWTIVDGRIRAPMSEMTTSKADGSFVLHPIPTDSELAVSASFGEAGTTESIMVRATNDQPVTLRIVEPETEPASGVVLSTEGRPIPGASVRIWAFRLTPRGAMEGVRLVRFDGTDDLVTDRDGRFVTPRPLRRDFHYRAFASARGYFPNQSRILDSVGSGPRTFPPLVLVSESRRVAVEGRVVDRDGSPVEGVTIRMSSDEPRDRRAATDGEGRFRLADIPAGSRFLSTDKSGFRFSGQSIEAGAAPLELRLTRLDEPASTSMVTRKFPSPGLGLARRILAPYAEKVVTEGDQSTRIKVLELLARVDPGRVLALIEGRIVAEAWLVDHLRHAASCSPATEAVAERMAMLGAIEDTESRVLGFLDAADALPESSKALKSERVERALADSRAIREPSRRVVTMARVADRLIDLGQLDRAKQLLDEARPLAESLPPAMAGGRARVEFAESLARVDPAAALVLTDGLIDPSMFDRCRIKIACRIAARAPLEAARVLESLRDPRSLVSALPSLCKALAPVDPAQARRLLTKTRLEDPCIAPYALGLMALAVADKDKSMATGWLREAFEVLGQLTESLASSTCNGDPAAVAAALLPVSERIDPTLVPEFFWRAVSFHRTGQGSEIRSEAVLALLLARYDNAVARRIVDPLVDRALVTNQTELGPLFTALAIVDPFRAVRLVEELPEPADLGFHQAKNAARLTLTATLLQGAPGCWKDATARLLHIEVEASSAGD